MKFASPLRSLALLAASFVAATPARAQTPPPPEPDAVVPADPPSVTVARPWLYAADPTPPPPMHVLASLGVNYAQVNRGAARPFAGDIAHAGAVFSAGGELGLSRFASIEAQGLFAGDGSKVGGGAMLGASLFPLPAGSPVKLAVSGGYLRELGGDNGAWGRVAIAGDVGRARFVFTALGEHVFAAKRDGVDILLTAGASYRLVSFLRLGAEYVVQDLEEAGDPSGLDGGIRHFVGPNASVELARRVQITAGPAFGLSKGSPTVLGRLAATYAF